MSTKISADVIIGGKVYTLSGYESEEYLQKVASYLNKKFDEVKTSFEEYNYLSQDTKNLLLNLNIIDDYFKAKERVDELETDIEEARTNQSNMKHEMISLQIKMDTLKETITELENKNKELTLNKEQLEAALETKLLG